MERRSKTMRETDLEKLLVEMLVHNMFVYIQRHTVHSQTRSYANLSNIHQKKWKQNSMGDIIFAKAVGERLPVANRVMNP